MQFPAELLPWVTRQLAAGHSVDQLAAHLITAMGYAPQVADRLIAAARDGHSHLPAPPIGTRPDIERDAQGRAPADVETLSGHRARVAFELAAPQVLLLLDFLAPDVIESVQAELADRATRVDRYLDTDRAAQDWLLPDTGAAAQCLGAAARALRWPRERWGLPIVRDTMTGQAFDLHYDAFGTGAVDDQAFKAIHGDVGRIGTLLIYLQAADAGGATYFANLGLRVAPRAGDALYFGYPRDDLQRSGVLHGGEEVRAGTKRIMTLWCYDRELRRGTAAQG